jgi:hypothetical protein
MSEGLQTEEGLSQGLKRLELRLRWSQILAACLQGSPGNSRLHPLSQDSVTEIAGLRHGYLTSQRKLWHWLHWSKCQQDPETVIFGARFSVPSKTHSLHCIWFPCGWDIFARWKQGFSDCPCSVPPYPRAAGKKSFRGTLACQSGGLKPAVNQPAVSVGTRRCWG